MMGQQNPNFVVGFVRFVLDQGAGALAPGVANGKQVRETWQAVGRRLYGKDLFNRVMLEEIEARKRGGNHAEVGVSAVRGDQGQPAQAG